MKPLPVREKQGSVALKNINIVDKAVSSHFWQVSPSESFVLILKRHYGLIAPAKSSHSD